MDILEIMEQRHSVRTYLDKPLTAEQIGIDPIEPDVGAGA